MASWKILFDVTRQETTQVGRCKICHEVIRGAVGVSSNFIRHLKRKHKDDYHPAQSGEQTEPRINPALAGTHSGVSFHTEVPLGQALMHMTRRDMEQFRVVERHGLEQFDTERREGSKRAVPSSWKHFKRMESLLGARAALRELDDSQDTAGDEGTEDSETDRSFVIAPLEGMYADSQEEYIVPTTTDPSMPSTSGTSSADATSLRLSEVRSLADPPSSAQELLSIQIKEEVTDEQMEQESFQQPSRSPPTATVTSTPLVTFPEAISESAPILPPHPVFSTSEPAHLPSLTEPEAQPAIAAPSLDATRPPLEQTTTTGGFNRSRKRPATPWITLSATERKAKVELEILFAQRRKIEAELRKFEADERKVVAETLLLAEEMKRCEEEKKKFKAEAEFFLQEKAKSEEETKKAAAKAALLLEHKNFYVEQQKTEMVRRRMLLLEMRKMKHDLKLLQ